MTTPALPPAPKCSPHPVGHAVTPRLARTGCPRPLSCQRGHPATYAAASGLPSRSGTSHVATPLFKGDVRPRHKLVRQSCSPTGKFTYSLISWC